MTRDDEVVIDSHDHAAWDTITRQVLQPDDPDGSVVVVLFTADGQHAGTVRLGMPDPPDAMAVVQAGVGLLGSLRQWENAASAAVVVYGPAHIAGPVTAMTTAVLAQAGLDARDVVRVREGRVWSYLCPDADCHAGGPGLPADPLSDAAIQVATVIGREQL